MDNFDLKKYLVENKVTKQSLLNKESRIPGNILIESTTKIPDQIQKLIDYMIDNKIVAKVVKVKKGSANHDKFMKDAKSAIDKKILMVKHNPINDLEMKISLGPEAIKKIKF